MDVLGLIAVLSFGLICFGIGYTFGKDNNKTQKIAAPVCDMILIILKLGSHLFKA